MQKDLNSDGKGKSANFSVDGDPMVIDHMSIVLEVSSDLIGLMNNK